MNGKREKMGPKSGIWMRIFNDKAKKMRFRIWSCQVFWLWEFFLGLGFRLVKEFASAENESIVCSFPYKRSKLRTTGKLVLLLPTSQSVRHLFLSRCLLTFNISPHEVCTCPSILQLCISLKVLEVTRRCYLCNEFESKC
jgi:hypothetical protein